MSGDAASFIHDLTYDDLPPSAVEQALRCLLDLSAVAVAGSTTAMSRIARDHAVENFAGRAHQSRLLFDGRTTSPVGAAFAGAATMDSFDGHDGHALTKGHTGAALLPALLAFADTRAPTDGKTFLTLLVLGYEIGTRAGIALHASTPDYHSSGAWNALACAAVGARALHLTPSQTHDALGIAEYHGPRAPMMRCIDHPTMVKDSSAWGALTGVSAALLAEQDFTGAPAITVTDDSTRNIWEDLGQQWRINEQYLKPFPVCRWTHPALQAALDIRGRHEVPLASIDHLEVATFHAATRLATRHPQTTEEAQYSLPFAVASALVHGTITAAVLAAPRNQHPEVTRLSEAMVLTEQPDYEALFPAERHAHIDVVLRSGQRLPGQPTTAKGGPDNPLTNDEILTKFVTLSEEVLDDQRTQSIKDAVAALPTADTSATLLDHLLSPIGPARGS